MIKCRRVKDSFKKSAFWITRVFTGVTSRSNSRASLRSPYRESAVLDYAGLRRIQHSASTDELKLYRKSAFTLAEVLITLGIIGVVASMTIPTLINKYQKVQYVTQLKKSYTTLQNGFKLMMAREGVSYLTDTDEWKSFTSDYLGTNDTDVVNLFKKNFNVVDVRSQDNYEIKELYDEGGEFAYPFPGKSIIFSDGSLLQLTIYKTAQTTSNTSKIKALGGHMQDYVSNFDIDVNGVKGPNQFGRDVYKFYLSNDGNLFPYYGRDHAIYKAKGSYNWDIYHWTRAYQRCAKNSKVLSIFDFVEGSGCAARIIESGWVMDY